MCGIAGFYGSGSQEVLDRMIDVVAYRGPDDRGVFVHGSVGLGHRRLSIIDTSSGGHQPLANSSETIWIVFNGEIYNHRELRTRLTQPHQFKGTSDTEIIVYLYEEMGIEAFSLLEGMFAIALYDIRKGELFLVRDRMGEKPLFWTKVGTTLIFGSEQKSILEHPLYTKELNIRALHKYLSFEYVPTPHSFFLGIEKVPPASLLRFSGSEVVIQTYWDITRTFFPHQKESFDEREAIQGFGEVLSQSVEKCLVSDVPVGVFLSGGIDSSAIAYYAQKCAAVPIDTFSIGFREPSFDESSYARIVAAHLKTRHHERIFSVHELLSGVEDTITRMDEPLADPSILPTTLLSQFAREHVTVALGGDGGDELLCGYDTFRAEQYASLFLYLPESVRKGIAVVVDCLPTSFENISLDFKLKKFVSGFDGDSRYRHIRWLGSFSRNEKKALYRPGVYEALASENEYSDIDSFFSTDTLLTSMARIQLLYQRTYLLDDILTKVDRASMLSSLEVRAPFLNHRVVEYLNALPIEYKMQGRYTKYVLKKLLHGVLPDTIVERKKKGFGIPLAEWLTNELRPLSLELLSREAVEYRGLFEFTYVEQLLADHMAKRVDGRKKIWTLMVLEMWFRAWMPRYQFRN